MKEVKTIPQLEYGSRRDPWLDKLFDGKLYQLDPADYQDRYASVRSASSAVKQAAQHRDITVTVAIRGESLYVQATTNGQGNKVRKVPTTRVRKATAKDLQGVAKDMGLSVAEVNELVTPAKRAGKAATRPRKAAAKRAS
jgi:hypothetical protein